MTRYAPPQNNASRAPRLIVIGNGMVGQRLLEELIRQESSYEIMVFCEEPYPAYDRIQLSQYFNDKPNIALASESFFQEHDITLLLNQAAVGIDRINRLVYSTSGQAHTYDKLVLATGAVPYIPPTEGYSQPHCLSYRTLADVDAIKQSAHDSRCGVVIGGGLLGLEAAGALNTLKLETHIVEYSTHLMASQIDKAGGHLLHDKIKAMGIHVHTQKKTEAIEPGQTRRYRLRFADNDHLETDMVVFSAGIRPADTLANICRLAVGKRGGVAINQHCQSSDPDIYAIGDVASWQDRTFGLVAPGYEMARVCAAHLLGHSEPVFQGSTPSTKLKLLGVEVGSIGDAHARTPDSIYCMIDDKLSGHYAKLVMDKSGKSLLGAVLVGNTSNFSLLEQYYSNQLPMPATPTALITPSASEAPLLGVQALPDSAQICSCNNVNKATLCSAVAAGCTTLGDLKAKTRAGTTCGGCLPMVKQILESALEALGMEVDKSLCEHFPHSRQELYHLVRVHGIHDFKTLIEQHGNGHGCDICKPTVASILASCWNDYVLSSNNAPLQDSNDAFLANIQKDGTYSVVPRIPGGEITPDKLVVIGEVARKHALYTKITGGQRIDLFGARLEQLPVIWKELVDAGFESGHAYGKALRTAKSCVGSTWCRFGVQDSVSMAIMLENRYRGVRAPHKLKMAVSGCTRECAEAQSKDVGVIATEQGWNLYVCGNGGMRPRHAELLACDLDDAALIRSIDRFLMFYIRTADRLQRTATWRENLDGGLHYLKQVVLEDSLGICDELEAQMQLLVDSYECEWARTLKDEKALRRFRPAINDNRPDEHIVHVIERDQPRPAKAQERAALAADAMAF